MLKNQLHCEKLWLLISIKKEKICKVDFSTLKTHKKQKIDYGMGNLISSSEIENPDTLTGNGRRDLLNT